MRLGEPVVAAVDQIDEIRDAEPGEIIEGALSVVSGGDADVATRVAKLSQRVHRVTERGELTHRRRGVRLGDRSIDGRPIVPGRAKARNDRRPDIGSGSRCRDTVGHQRRRADPEGREHS